MKKLPLRHATAAAEATAIDGRELAAFEAQLEAELAAAVEMMAEIEREMALAAFQQKLADEIAAAAAATAKYRTKMARDAAMAKSSAA